MGIFNELKKIIRGDVINDPPTLKQYGRDASIFEIKPALVIHPRDSDDVKTLVKFVSENKKGYPELSITARSGGTDMTGGPLNSSVIVSFTKYMNRIEPVFGDEIMAEPGAYYRDFEKETLRKNLILPSYPASREICAIGGMINNNAGGEKSLIYGQTENYVRELEVILRDGNQYTLHPLLQQELEQKMSLPTLEGKIYKETYELIRDNYELIQKAKPNVSKNSSGYQLWDVWDKQKGIFDLTKLFVGSQGTLGLVTRAKFRLVPIKKHYRMAVLFLKNLDNLGQVTNIILKLKPESFESYDDHTFKLALKYFPSFAKLLGTKNVFSMAIQFLPEIWMTFTSGIPKLVLLVEFAEDDGNIMEKKLNELEENVENYNSTAHSKNRVKLRVTKNAKESRKYWLMRRESFNLLRHKIKDRQAAPFIDDLVVRPEKLPEFLPRLNKILSEYNITYTIAGHVGSGNFHIIPLMNLASETDRKIIPELADKVYDLVLEFRGSITGEHNDGLIRSPYLKKMYGEEIYRLFEETKKIFDPENIFNPGKKVGSNLNFSLSHIKNSG